VKKRFLWLALCFLCAAASACSTKTEAAGSGGIDVDLTALSSTMVYGEVFNMMQNPDDYVGKTIKANGPYYASFFPETGEYYHFVIVRDATACCQQGLEFKVDGNPELAYRYPEDFPTDETLVELVGVYNAYEELGETYYYLSVKDIAVL
jgi:hypothetical protein